MKTIFSELRVLWESIEKDALNKCIQEVAEHSGNIVCLGAGRMGYAVQSFAMRLSHLGYSAFMFGDTNLPRVKSGDIVIVNSSSGETTSIIVLAKIAKENGCRIICFTSSKGSTLAKLADIVVSYETISSKQLMKSAYEQFSLLLFDHISMCILDVTRKEKSWVEKNHSILE